MVSRIWLACGLAAATMAWAPTVRAGTLVVCTEASPDVPIS